MSSPLNRVRPAFAATAFVASVLHAALLTASMVATDSSNLNTPGNNLVRFVLISIGGVPVAAAVTLVLGVPAYFLVRTTIGVNVVSTVGSGVLIGLVVSVVFAGIVPTALISRLPTGLVIGGISGAVWWLLASAGPKAMPVESGRTH